MDFRLIDAFIRSIWKRMIPNMIKQIQT